MAKLPPPITHEKVQVVMTIENGQVIDTRKVRDNELIASMDTFFWMAKKAGTPAGAAGPAAVPPEAHRCTPYAPHRLSQPEG